MHKEWKRNKGRKVQLNKYKSQRTYKITKLIARKYLYLLQHFGTHQDSPKERISDAAKKSESKSKEEIFPRCFVCHSSLSCPILKFRRGKSGVTKSVRDPTWNRISATDQFIYYFTREKQNILWTTGACEALDCAKIEKYSSKRVKKQLWKENQRQCVNVNNKNCNFHYNWNNENVKLL